MEIQKLGQINNPTIENPWALGDVPLFSEMEALHGRGEAFCLFFWAHAPVLRLRFDHTVLDRGPAHMIRCSTHRFVARIAPVHLLLHISTYIWVLPRRIALAMRFTAPA